MAEALQSEVLQAAAEEHGAETVQDPRIRRTRELLQQAFGRLLKEKDFDKISVQDITDAATVNRATFYLHYPDKFALLECKVAGDFHALLASRGVTFDGTCSGALSNIVQGVCDFLTLTHGDRFERQLQMEPHLEAAIVAVVRGMLLDGLQRHPAAGTMPAAIRAAATASAVLGAAREWSRRPDREPSETFCTAAAAMIVPLLHGAA